MKLIISADDLGLSKSVTDGILYAYKNKLVTSTSIFSNLDYTSYAINALKETTVCDVGLHVNFTVGTSLTKNKKICPFECDRLVDHAKKVEFLNTISYQEAILEIYEQLENLTKNGVKISHIDTHGGIENITNIFEAVSDVAKKENLPFRCYDKDLKLILKNKQVKTVDKFYMNYFKKGVSVETLEKIVDENKNTNNTCLIMTHAGFVDDYTMNFSNYNEMRKVELDTLATFIKNSNLEDVEFINHNDL